jgi:hypothetical protein
VSSTSFNLREFKYRRTKINKKNHSEKTRKFIEKSPKVGIAQTLLMTDLCKIKFDKGFIKLIDPHKTEHG